MMSRFEVPDDPKVGNKRKLPMTPLSSRPQDSTHDTQGNPPSNPRSTSAAPSPLSSESPNSKRPRLVQDSPRSEKASSSAKSNTTNTSNQPIESPSNGSNESGLRPSDSSGTGHNEALSGGTDLSRYPLRILPRTPAQNQPKGLRHFSYQVCQKMYQLKSTTYGAISSALVGEARQESRARQERLGTPPHRVTPLALSEAKNIKRRVYDALNVFIAADIVTKKGKFIYWSGLEHLNSDLSIFPSSPSSPSPSDFPGVSLGTRAQGRKQLMEYEELKDKVRGKASLLEDLTLQFLGTAAMMSRYSRLSPQQNEKLIDDGVLKPPFVLIHCPSAETGISCQTSKGREMIDFQFDRPFRIHDENAVLQMIGDRWVKKSPRGSTPVQLQQYLPSYFPEHAQAARQVEIAALSDRLRTTSSKR